LNPESEFTRKRLTKFLCQELLYEMVTHNLDGAREKEVGDYLETCRESQREFDNLNKGLRFTLTAAQVKVSPALYHALENFEPHWQKQLRAWTLSSSQKGWRMLPYIFAALVVVVGLLATKPWIEKANEDVMLAEHLKKEPDMADLEKPKPSAPAQPVQAATPPAPPSAEEEAPPPPLKPEAAASPAYLPDVMESMAKDIKNLKPSNLFAGKAAEAARKVEAESDEQAQPKDTEEAMGRGFLHRATIEVQDFQNSWPAIRDKIAALGGKVAGNVELGWLRRPTEAYFHFTLPESNMNELEIFLGTFGPVQFSKDRHPRVMPEGQFRIIMSVKDGMTQNEAPSETP